ncbi:MAG: enoyl-CoA hydratase/isomerase family protein [Smithella sp.]
MNDNKEVIFFRSKSMASIILNRPKVLNSLNMAMISTLTSYFHEALADEKCKFILFRGSGSRSFCSGGDIKELTHMVKENDFNKATSFFAKEFTLDLMIRNSPKPVIVIADGVTMGGGLGIAAGADIVIATEHTRMAMPEARIGFFPDVGATGWLFLKCPPGYPEYLALTGYAMQGKECVRLGLATHFIKSASIDQLTKSLEKYEPEDEPDKESLVLKLGIIWRLSLILIFHKIRKWIHGLPNIFPKSRIWI